MQQAPSEAPNHGIGAAVAVNLLEIPPVSCPCGLARRAYTQCADAPATVHLTNISVDARTHYHKRLTETYVILSCGPDAAIELDGQKIPVRPLTSVMIPPGVRHRALGEMQVVIFCTPKFDPADEHFD